MGNKDMFRTAVLGGYQKEDVLDYVRSLENENETIRVLTKKENSEIKAQLEREKAAGEELRKTLAAMQEEIQLLEEEKRKLEQKCGQMEKYISIFAAAMDGREAVTGQPQRSEADANTETEAEEVKVQTGLEAEAETEEAKMETEVQAVLPEMEQEQRQEQEQEQERKEDAPAASAYERKAQESLQEAREKIGELLKSLEAV